MDQSGFRFHAYPAVRVCYKRFPEGKGMRGCFSISAVCFVTLAFLAAGSQVASSQPRLDVFVTPFPNAPFSGVIQVQRTFIDKDGTVSSYKTMREDRPPTRRAASSTKSELSSRSLSPASRMSGAS